MHHANLLEDQPIAWTPTPEVIERAQLTKFMKQVGVSTWDELYAYSIRDVGKFTEEVLKFLDIKFDPPYEKLLDTSDGIEFPKWFARNADTPVRNEGEARTTAATFANKKGWHERGYLPHFDAVATQFVTFRLGDSLPQNVLKGFKKRLEQDDLTDNSDEYREMVEHYLDQGMGACILKNQEIAAIVQRTLEYEDGKSCNLLGWVIMPNHVHALLRPLQGHSLSDIMKRIKGVSARRINELLGKSGSVWQPDYFDRFIRDADHYGRTFDYVRNNPVKAGLCLTPEDWRFSSFSPEEPAIADKSVRVPTAGLNITEMCLDRWLPERGHSCPHNLSDQAAVIWEDESGDTAHVTYAELHKSVESCAASLRKHGLGTGDAIVLHLPMMVNTVIALLAINRIGAIATPVFSGYGVDAIASRMNAVGAKAIFTASGFLRRGKVFDSFEVAIKAISNCPTITKIFVEDQCGPEYEDLYERHASNYEKFGERLVFIDGLISQSETYADRTTKNQTLRRPEPTSAEDPLIILYTSGTTGKPKGIAHTHASFPIKAAQDMAFGTDVGKGTRICWYTDIGWMMGPWLIYGALINGATICIYDGAPDYPTPDRMWQFCAKHKVEVLGISPTLIRALSKSENERGSSPHVSKGQITDEDLPERRKDAKEEGKKAPYERHDLSSLRLFASTGEPWNPAPWWWLFEKAGNSKLPIINYSGGTEIAGGILMGNPLLPQKPCSFPAPCPGMDADILDEDGKPVEHGKVGELVIKQPWIGMARGFWQEKERYLDTYWRRFKDVWVHGDFAMRDKDGHWFILGRSDDTLKVAGKRVGPAEVESLLVAHPLVTEAAVIGVPDEAKGTAMVAFIVINAEGRISNIESAGSKNSSLITHHSSLETELKALVARDMGKPLAPYKIHFVSALPKTRNAKVMRRVIRSAYLDEDLGDLSALEDPAAVDGITSLHKVSVLSIRPGSQTR